MSVPSKIACGSPVAAALFVAGTAPAHAAALSELALPWPWALPFIGLLLSIAVGPLLAPKLWQVHHGKIAFVWSALAITPLAALYGVPTALTALSHAILDEYSSFIILLTALYVVTGGILVTGSLRGTPLVNTAVLAFGTAIASIVGTTGAAMILVRPLLRANSARLHNVHVVVFFIFLAANIGGALSPLGDPPLFVGFLRGVDFFWTTTHLWRQTGLTAVIVLAAFVAVDIYYYRQDRRVAVVGEKAPDEPIRVHGLVNLALIVLIVGAILVSALWKPGVTFEIYDSTLELQDIVRDVVLVAIAVASLVLTREEHRERNGFTIEPILEVAKLFAGIFVCIVPVTVMLQMRHAGPFSWVLTLMTNESGEPHNVAYFWLTGILSAVLDNAPTYLVFFDLAGGDAGRLMSEFAPTLAAISMGAVYMGGFTYIGNAPNFMIYAIATERGVKMPSFFGFMMWSGAVLSPVFAVVTYIFVMPRP
ncbi:MAG TPA: sodium:proton antiporter [Xanthobacteraceae bacterium]|jgi:Na+/H+ antiporter NhaD/arsenite permease-like protein|nr:sodium:proton antiporter [Xanthobacteraceae bacterium]